MPRELHRAQRLYGKVNAFVCSPEQRAQVETFSALKRFVVETWYENTPWPLTLFANYVDYYIVSSLTDLSADIRDIYYIEFRLREHGAQLLALNESELDVELSVARPLIRQLAFRARQYEKNRLGKKRADYKGTHKSKNKP